MSLLSWLWSGGPGPGPSLPIGSGAAAGPGGVFLIFGGASPVARPGAVGFASGQATALGVGAALGTLGSVGTAAGTAAAAATGRSTRAAVGLAHGTGTATGTTTVVNLGPGFLDSLALELAIGGGAFLPAGFQANAFGGSAWIAVTSDTLASDPIIVDYGVQGHTPSDRVASTGTMTFTLNNASDNAGAVEGYYSPLNVLRRSGLDLNVGARLRLGINGQTYYKFLGRLAEINPDPGRYGSLRVPCVAVDLMDDWAANLTPVALPVIANTNSGILIAVLLNTLLGTPDLFPAATDIDPGVDTLAYVFHDPERRKIRELLTDLVMSELGFAALVGGATTAGVFRFLNRHAATTDAVQASFINQFSVENGFSATTARDDLASSIEVFVYPTHIDAAPLDLFSLDGTPLLVLGFDRAVVHLPFHNPNEPNAPVAALSLIQPVPHVDYTINSQVNGLGTDLTAAFSVLHAQPLGGVEAVIQILNTGPTPGFVTLLKGRGTGLYISEASARVDLDTVYGRRPLQVVMPLQDNVNTATDIANYFSHIYQTPYGQVESIRFCANKTQTLMTAAITLEPGDLIYLEETITGIAGTFRIQGVHLEFTNGIVWCTWRLANVVRQQFWLLGTPDSSELGLATILGF